MGLTGLPALRGAGGGVGPALRSRPYYLAIYGDSFGQRSQDILGSPNIIDGTVVDPQNGEWASDDTNRVGGVQWGFAPAVQDVSGGRLVAPYQLNHAIGGFNTGQLSRYESPDNTPFYLDEFLDRMEALPPALAPDAVIFQAGTNDGVTVFSAASSYAQIKKICDQIVARLGIPIFLSTVLPRGNSTDTGSRLTPDRVAVTNELNARLIGDGYPGLAAETGLAGMVVVIDPRDNFRLTPVNGTTILENDVIPAMVYDGLHLSQPGCRVLGDAYAAAVAAYFAGIAVQLPTDAASYIDNNLMAGTSGTLARTGNGASNTGFTLNGSGSSPIAGVAPDGWTVTTTANGGATSWNGTDPNNVKGNLQVSKEAADVGDAIVLSFDCSSSTTTNANVRAVEAWAPITLPDVSELAVGDYFEGIAKVELTRRSGLPIAGLLGFSIELRLTEPDAVARVARSNVAAPNGTPNMEWEDREFTGADALILRTPPRVRKTGTYTVAEVGVLIYVAGQVADIDFVAKVSQAAVRKITATGDGGPPAATVPGIMSAPTVTALGADSVEVDLAAAPDDGGSAILSYDLRWSDDEAAWTVVTGITDPDTIGSLDAETEYFVQTRAVNAVGPGPWSASGSDTTGAAATVPGTMSAPAVTGASSTSVSVDRAAAPSDGGSAITSYDLRWSTDEATWTTVTGISDPQTVSSLAVWTNYYVQTRAVNGVGNGAWSLSGQGETLMDGITIMSVTQSLSATDTTAVAINLPATVNSGELLVLALAFDGNPTINASNITIGTDWQAIGDKVGNSNTSRIIILARVADGTEDGGQVTFALATAEQYSAAVLRVGMSHGGMAVSVSAQGNNTTPDTANVSPGWGALNALWLSILSKDAEDEAGWTAPTNFTITHLRTSSASGQATLAIAHRRVALASLNPGTWTTDAGQWVGYTVACRPS